MLGKFDETRLTAFISTMPLDSFPVAQKFAAEQTPEAHASHA
ncbi:MAG TPA: hypothetical protein VNX27_04370 [Chthoniobacterales bacterium]|nr:hypothetical protein [Chthoniobacterales bacterium]